MAKIPKIDAHASEIFHVISLTRLFFDQVLNGLDTGMDMASSIQKPSLYIHSVHWGTALIKVSIYMQQLITFTKMCSVPSTELVFFVGSVNRSTVWGLGLLSVCLVAIQLTGISSTSESLDWWQCVLWLESCWWFC